MVIIKKYDKYCKKNINMIELGYWNTYNKIRTLR